MRVEVAGQQLGQLGWLNDVGHAPGLRIQRGFRAVEADHDLTRVHPRRQIVIHGPVHGVTAHQAGSRDVPQWAFDDGDRIGPGFTVVAGDDLHIAVACLLDEHQQLTAEDEGNALLVRQAQELLPGFAAVSRAGDSQAVVRLFPFARPLRGGDEEGAVIQPPQVRVVEEEAGVVGYLQGDGEFLRQRVGVRVHRELPPQSSDRLRRVGCAWICRMRHIQPQTNVPAWRDVNEWKTHA